MDTVTLAKIYEKQGHLEDAKKIYERLLKDDPLNSELKSSLLRVSGYHNDMVDYFISLDKRDQFIAFERWLVKPWS